MASERWSYQVVEVKPGFLGSTRDAAQERLTQLGLQGWELVSAIQSQRFAPVQLYMRKPAP
ncbi:DUF4177 domain-containing protein [Cognatiluteimonas telluris]|jgi:hypothetical protein|uniref:DUF4177 domain-containing protein n=1 Tax=Cognatiluteimonas telluris TaxID=1104775 RepID=UPI00140DD9E1|nr:DUF4177 domain-containing protein [Lysobacter telluris]